MEASVLDALNDLGYSGPVANENDLTVAISSGSDNVMFSRIVSWLTQQLATHGSIQLTVDPIQDKVESERFQKDVVSFVRALEFPYGNLVTVETSRCFKSQKDCITLLDFLCSELQAAKMISANGSMANRVEQEIEALEAANIKNICLALGLPKPANTIPSSLLFEKITAKINPLLGNVRLAEPLLSDALPSSSLSVLLEVNERLCDEYSVRRQMLLKRLDVTVQSFHLADAAKGRLDLVADRFLPIRRVLSERSGVGLAHLYAARKDLLVVEKFSSGADHDAVRSKLSKLIIAKVPDRGGRAMDMEPPAPDMPSFRKREAGFDGARGGRGYGGRGRGGKRHNQDNWNHRDDNQNNSWKKKKGKHNWQGSDYYNY